MSTVRVIRRDAAELSDTAIAGIVEDALREQALLDEMTAAVRAGDSRKVMDLARQVCGLEDDPDLLPPAA
jgi:hypothetical protein